MREITRSRAGPHGARYFTINFFADYSFKNRNEVKHILQWWRFTRDFTKLK